MDRTLSRVAKELNVEQDIIRETLSNEGIMIGIGHFAVITEEEFQLLVSRFT